LKTSGFELPTWSDPFAQGRNAGNSKQFGDKKGIVSSFNFPLTQYTQSISIPFAKSRSQEMQNHKFRAWLAEFEPVPPVPPPPPPAEAWTGVHPMFCDFTVLS